VKALALVLLAGCLQPYSRLTNDRADPKLRKIEEAKILDMQVHLHKQPGLCPGKRGKLYVNANVQWPGAKPVVRNLGKDVDSLQPAAFSIKGPLVKGDANAHLQPSGDVLASVEKGFDLHIVYKPNPKFTYDVNFAPEYSCYQGWYSDGGLGEGGGYGQNGGNGDWSQSGGNGSAGGRGGRGRDGGTVRAYVTIVSTKYYPRLLAVIANDNFFLAPVDRSLELGAVGGQGGTGGNGGAGGHGGDQPTESREIIEEGNKITVNFGVGGAGNGGNGAYGGPGGGGGNGGTVDVIIDSRFPELARLIKTDVRGGAGGYGGAGGGAGDGGGSNAERGAQYGNAGGAGGNGEDGQPGREGRASVRAGSVGTMFDLRGIAIVGAGSSPTMAPPPNKKRRHR
jgi:hypothetical protein